MSVWGGGCGGVAGGVGALSGCGGLQFVFWRASMLFWLGVDCPMALMVG